MFVSKNTRNGILIIAVGSVVGTMLAAIVLPWFNQLRAKVGV